MPLLFAISAIVVYLECAFHLELKQTTESISEPKWGFHFLSMLCGLLLLGVVNIVHKYFTFKKNHEDLMSYRIGQKLRPFPMLREMSRFIPEIIAVIVSVLLTCFAYQKEFNLYISNILGVMKVLWSPLCVLCMMLSIEIMVFMRDKYTQETSSTLLVVFVIAAIVADLCIGFIEIPEGMYKDFSVVAPKVAYSIFLGCLSFFAGKFMEMNASQKQQEEDQMDEDIQEINEHLMD